jgi:hypothetical protein
MFDVVDRVETDYASVEQRLSSSGEYLRKLALQAEQQSRALHILANLIERYLGKEDQEVVTEVIGCLLEK